MELEQEINVSNLGNSQTNLEGSISQTRCKIMRGYHIAGHVVTCVTASDQANIVIISKGHPGLPANIFNI